MEAAEEKYKNVTAELETFWAKLSQGQKQGQSYGDGLSEQQMASIEAALQNELDKRSQDCQVGMPLLACCLPCGFSWSPTVWKAATVVANQATDVLNVC